MIKRWARRFIPEIVKQAILRLKKTFYRLIRTWVVPWTASSRLASQLYYTILSRAFAREQQAVLYGRYKHDENAARQEAADDFSLLRRNTHRLEKGLLMQPRRDVFALDYIKETVETYSDRLRVLQNGRSIDGNQKELLWTRDVLRAYFQVTGDHPTIRQAHRIFLHTEKETEFNTEKPKRGRVNKRIPYRRDLDELPVSYEELRQLAFKRRSVRWFSEENVSRDSIDKALSIALEAPSACNRQPYEFRVYDDPELVGEISDLPGGTTGYAENIPVLVVIIGRLRAYFSERDRHVIYIDASLAAMNFMLALETLGLSSCPINWPDVENRERAMEEALSLEPDERPVMLLAVGHPDPEGLVAYSQKKELSQIRSYNKQ
jgi:nitroreductase